MSPYYLHAVFLLPDGFFDYLEDRIELVKNSRAICSEIPFLDDKDTKKKYKQLRKINKCINGLDSTLSQAIQETIHIEGDPREIVEIFHQLDEDIETLKHEVNILTLKLQLLEKQSLQYKQERDSLCTKNEALKNHTKILEQQVNEGITKILPEEHM